MRVSGEQRQEMTFATDRVGARPHHTEPMKRSWSNRTAFAVVLATGAFLIACGGDKTTEPSPQSQPPAALRLIIPDTITRGQAFSLTVTALDAQGQTNTNWTGTVSLSASTGSITPATVNVSRGTATVQATLGQYAGEVTITSSVGTVAGSRAAVVLSGQPAALLEIHPATFMLPGIGATQSLTARAFDADGLPTVAIISWQSTRSGVVSVSPAGVATAATVGSASITARAGAVESDPAIAYVTSPAAGVVLVADELITSGLTPVNAQAPYGPGWQYRVRLTGPAPQVGQLLVSRGEKPLAGRVIAVQPAGAGFDVTLELVRLEELLPGLSIDQTIPLRLKPAAASYSLARAPWAAIVEGEFALGSFKCTSSLTQPNSNPFTMASVTTDITPTLQAHIVNTDTHKRFVVQGSLSASLRVNPTLTAAVNGSIECKAEGGDIPIPVGGALAPFFGARVKIGLGFGLEGGVTLATMGLDLQVSGVSTLSIGYDSNSPGTSVFNITGNATGSVKPDLPSPSSDFRVTAGASAFLWADLLFGAPDYFPGSAALQLTLLEAKAGVKQDFNLSTADVQAADAAYASNFSLGRFFSGGTTKNLQQIVDGALSFVGVSISPFKYSASDSALAKSPEGSFQIVPSRVRATRTSVRGDTATFIVDLSRTDYLTRYAVESVKLFHKPSASAPLVPAPGSCASITPTTASQSLFTCKTDLPLSMVGDQTFYAFVKPILIVPLPVLLEVAKDAKATVTVDTATVLYTNDFQATAGAEWSPQTITQSPSGEKFLGTFAAGEVTLSLANVPAHDTVKIEFDFFTLRDWEGNASPATGGPDIMSFLVDGQTVLRTTFSTKAGAGFEQSYPGTYPGANNPAMTGASATGSLGYPDGSSHTSDARYRLSFTVPHNAGTIQLTLRNESNASSPNLPGKELFGLDNIRVTVR